MFTVPRDHRGESARKAASVVYLALADVSEAALRDLVVAYCGGRELWELSLKVRLEDRKSETMSSFSKRFGIRWTLYTGTERIAAVLLICLGELTTDLDEQSEAEIQVVKSAAKELKRHRNAFCSVLRWLCRSKSTLTTQSVPAHNRLSTDFGRSPFIDDLAEANLRLMELHGIQHLQLHAFISGGRLQLRPRCRHLVDLLYAFLLADFQGKSSDQMGIKTCRRCEKLFSATPRKEHCSQACQEGKYWTRQKRADDQYVRRFEDYAPADLRRRWREPSVRERFRQIEQNWPPGAEIRSKIQKIKAALK